MDQTAQIALGAAGADASGMIICHLFLAADWIVKSVMVMLLIASVGCWAIIFDQWLQLRALRRSASDFAEAFWSGGSREDTYDWMAHPPRAPMPAVSPQALGEDRERVRE